MRSVIRYLLFVIGVALPIFVSGADRKFDESWDSALGYSKTLALRWGGGDSIDYTHRARYGTSPVVLTNAGQTVVWLVMGTGATLTNNYISATGTVQSTAGTVKFFVPPEETNLTPGKYRGFVRTFTPGSGITNAVTLCYQDITVDWTPESAEYAVVVPQTNYYSSVEVDALFALVDADITDITGRVARVEARTNVWNAAAVTATNNETRITSVEAYTNMAASAYGWGNHGAAGYATGTPLYVESDPAWTAGTNAIWQAIETTSNSLVNTQGDVSSIVGNISNSYVVVNGTKILGSLVYNDRPEYDDNDSALEVRFDFFNQKWTVLDASGEIVLGIHPTSTSYLPPYNGYLDESGDPVAVTVEFFKLPDVPTNRTSSVIGGFYTDGTNETVYVRRD